MTEPSGHCPYLGLKQNRAIRFASPTPEHRCYVSGEPLEIPVDQASYCLSQGHVQCPLYMGLSLPTTTDPTPALVGGALVAPEGGLRGWLGSLSPRDRAIYAIMLGMLAIIMAIYLFVGLQTLLNRPNGGGIVGSPTDVPPTLAATSAPATDAPTATDLPTPTNLPSSTPSPSATQMPPTVQIILPPTQRPTLLPTIAVPTTAVSATVTPTTSGPTGPTAAPTTSGPSVTSAPPTTAPSTAVPTTAAPAPAVPATAAPTTSAPPPATSAPPATQAPPPAATVTPRPTSTPQNPTSRPPLPPTQAPPPPTQAPPPAVSTEALTLYFADTTGTLYVPVRRNTRVENNQVATAAIRELVAGPRNGLNRLVPADVKLLGLTIADGTATANFDRTPGDDRGIASIVFTLTEFRATVERVQIQVNGRNLGTVRGRPTVNPLNPQGLAFDVNTTEFLPLYFVSVDGAHDVRVIRLVPKTRETAAATVRALLEGPGEYGNALRQVIPAGTELRGIKIQNGILLVDFTQPFSGAGDAALRTIVESLTTLPSVGGVQFLVEGKPFKEGRIFRRPAINPE